MAEVPVEIPVEGPVEVEGDVDWRRTAWGLVPLAALLVAVAMSALRAFEPAISGDYEAHLEYLEYVQRHRWVPRADQGFEMYHPPVYYVLSVLVAELAGSSLTSGAQAVAAASWAVEGMVAAVVVTRLGGRWAGAAAGAALVWLLPGQANVATRVYPETLAGLGVAILVLAVVRLRQGARSGYWWLAVGVPLAGLSKFSGLVAVAVALPVVVWAHRDRLRSLAGLLPGLILLGAFYGRNLLLYRTPTPLNADLFELERLGGRYADYPPGFFTRLALGECAAERSFYGSAWKWLWATDCGVKPPWTDTVDGVLLVVAVATTLVVAAAWACAAAKARRHLGWAVVAAVPAAVLAAFVGYNLRVPSGSSGLYLLVAVVPVAVAVGGFVSSAAARHQGAAYLTVLGWGAVMARASGVF